MNDNLLLLIIVKRGVNFGAFCEWLSHYGCIPKYSDYITYEVDLLVYEGKPYQNGNTLGTEWLTEFEFNYLLCFAIHYGYLKINE